MHQLREGRQAMSTPPHTPAKPLYTSDRATNAQDARQPLQTSKPKEGGK
ncbi:hypothetical protein GCM10017559_79820 [Streptosporangium longisporum]|uniref:Uncharacterized protein n=1 Tax=Streptosporangium longisporum TaxID=46187 RepID=A0ABP6LEN4_9ACTN